MNTKIITQNAAIAALYVSLTMLVAPMAFGQSVIQIRISELLMLLILINYSYIYGLTIGVFIANLFSPFGPLDIVVGTLATLIGLLIFIRADKLFLYKLKSELPRFIFFVFTLTVVNGLLIGLVITYSVTNTFIFNWFIAEFIKVATSELIICIIAVILYKLITQSETIKKILD